MKSCNIKSSLLRFLADGWRNQAYLDIIKGYILYIGIEDKAYRYDVHDNTVQRYIFDEPRRGGHSPDMACQTHMRKYSWWKYHYSCQWYRWRPIDYSANSCTCPSHIYGMTVAWTVIIQYICRYIYVRLPQDLMLSPDPITLLHSWIRASYVHWPWWRNQSNL